ncbi:MAG: AmmeMemoRadiSam system protein A [Pyrinomonas sp.]|uniref:AmmeMemoRadiSam system protein A n=1 Tax=Pyrinomonas sp. TaxID=2080306 RepID=UPI003325D4C5
MTAASAKYCLVSLARQAVEEYLVRGQVIRPPATARLARAACFVCIKTLDGKLRGCMGTVEPSQPSLAEEVIANAINAATRDPRFAPVSVEELLSLRFSVDILSALEPTTLDGLDPRTYGLLVENESRTKRGLLLPAIEGVETVEQQLAIVMHKAGLQGNEPFRLYRFTVQRFREDERNGAP